VLEAAFEAAPVIQEDELVQSGGCSSPLSIL
jgi:hypothetical protein